MAGGSGTRLYPLTKGISKQLLPIYDKPMVYYPLSVLMLADIRDILLISTPVDLPLFQRLLGDGSDFGVRLRYAVQPSPDGLAQALLIGEAFLDGEAACMILGDNIFYGQRFSEMLMKAVGAAEQRGRASVFGYRVQDPERYGVVGFDADGQAESLEEKPTQPKSPYAVVGLYFYPAGVSQIAAGLKPSARGELEITDLNRKYLEAGLLDVQLFGRGFAWLDTGTFDSLSAASVFVEALEKRQGCKIACLEELAFEKGWLSAAQLRALAEPMAKNQYGQYLLGLLKA